MSGLAAIGTDLAVATSGFAVAKLLAIEAPQRVGDVYLDIQLQITSFYFTWWYARVKS